MSTFEKENRKSESRWSHKCSDLLLYGYIRPLVPQHIGISLYYSICYAFYRNLLPKFKLCCNVHQLFLNKFNGKVSIISSKQGLHPATEVSFEPWTRIRHHNTNKTFIHKFEIQSIGHNLKFSIGIIPANQLQYSPITFEPNSHLIKLTHHNNRNYYVYGKTYLYYQNQSVDRNHRIYKWKYADIDEDWCHIGHKLGIAVNCKEWKLYLYCDDKEIHCIELDKNEIYYPIFCIYSPNKPDQDTYQIVTYCTDLHDVGTESDAFNKYILKQLPRKSYQLVLNLDIIDKPETIFELLWKGNMLIDLETYNGKFQYLFGLMQADTFGHNFWNDCQDDFQNKIVKNQELIKLWIIIEMYQYFRHNIYINLIRKQLSNMYCDTDINLLDCVSEIVTDYTMQNINEAYSEYFNNEENLENMTVLYCTVGISDGWRRKGLININKSLIEWMDEYVIPYVPYKYLFGVTAHYFIDYITKEGLDPDYLIKEELTKGLRKELEDVYERKLYDKYIDKFHLDVWSVFDVDSDDMCDEDWTPLRGKKKTKHREYNSYWKEKFLQGKESEFNS